MESVLLEIAVVILLVAANGVFAMAELAILTSKKHVLRTQAKAGSARAQQVLDLARRPDAFLSAVQVGITLVGILTGVFSGATLAGLLAGRLMQAGMTRAGAEGLGMAVIVALITFVTLIFGELLPKRLAMAHPNAAALYIVPVIRVVQVVFLPVVHVLSASVTLLARLLGVRRLSGPEVSDEEIKALVEDAQQSGVIETEEKEIIYRVMRFSDRFVSSLMTHRSEITWINVRESRERIQERIRRSNHSCYLVADGSLAEILGVVCVKNLFLRDDPLDHLRDALTEPLYVHEAATAPAMLAAFKESPTPMAVVVDEYGDIQGIVTLKDVLEALVGEIKEFAHQASSIVRREDGSYLVDARVPVDDLFELLGIVLPLRSSAASVNTLSGFMMHFLGEIPTEGEAFVSCGYSFEVVDMDGYRIDKVLIAKADPAAGSDGRCD